MTPSQILDLLIDLTPDQIQQVVELLGPCQIAIDLHNILIALKDYKD